MKSFELNRRQLLTTGAAGIALAGFARGSQAAEMSSEEEANVALVNAFCAAWSDNNLDALMAFFADDGAYRMTETTELADGHAAVAARIGSFLGNVERFDILDTFARGPMVVNERIDYFNDFAIKSWHGVGIFFIREGKIVDWYDYTIAMEQA